MIVSAVETAIHEGLVTLILYNRWILLGAILFLLGCISTSPLPTDSPAPTAPSNFTPTPPATPTSTPEPGTGAPGIGDTYYTTLGNGGYDVETYALVLDIDPPANTLNGQVQLQATATEQLITFNLDLVDLTVDAITVNGEPALFSINENELTITPNQPLMPGDEFQVSVLYHGMPGLIRTEAAPFEIGWSHSPDGAINVWSEPAAASSWFPNNNHPRDKATYQFEITVPDPWMVAATGSLQNTIQQNGSTTYIWEMNEPMATYLASISVDQYDVVTGTASNGILIRNYFPMDYPAVERQAYDIIPEVLVFLEELFGPYPFDEYGVVVTSQAGICDKAMLALEGQSLSLHCPFMNAENVVVHEIAHQWFGNSVSLENWQDIWLKEGFATYAEWLWNSQNDPAAIALAARAYRESSFDSQFPVAGPSRRDLYTIKSYFGGAIVLQALREEVGEETFFAIVRTYAERYRYGVAGTDEFISVAEEISGRNLDEFFNEWIFSSLLPELP
ncbi:MAG TPA: M1 family metallopeptidase [Anaerolineales bacterium]|nr:M1 family metallopeptidase [Anaerolineales bacterium]